MGLTWSSAQDTDLDQAEDYSARLQQFLLQKIKEAESWDEYEEIENKIGRQDLVDNDDDEIEIIDGEITEEVVLRQNDLEGKLNGTDSNFTVNLTPAKFGYSPHAPDFACTTGYGICAPLGLCWSCNDQVMKPNNVTKVGAEQMTVFLHLPGMVLEPARGNNTFKYGFSFNWDCDPLIPISLWASLLITLFLATILFWALFMISSLHTPNKFDDPKGPSIHVPQAD